MIDLNAQYEQLSEAINMIENGAQSYTIGSSTVTKANLAVLYRRQEDLLRKIEQQGDDGAYAAVFDFR